MEKEIQDRFERIEGNLERVTQGLVEITDRVGTITTAHLELQGAQLNTQKAHDRLAAKVDQVTGGIADLKILVDELIRRDLGRQ